MGTNNLSKKEFGELFSTAYDGIDLSGKDMTDFLKALAFSLTLTIDMETGIKASEEEILQELMMIDKETAQNKETLSLALFERLKISYILPLSEERVSDIDEACIIETEEE